MLSLKRSQNMMKMTTRAFTLLEVAIALAILMLIASVTGVQVKQLVDRHRFERHLLDLFAHLQEAQLFSCAYQTDLRLELFDEKGHIGYQFLTDEPLPESQLSQEKKELPLVKALFVNGVKQKQVHIDIYSGGRVAPSLLLSFSPSNRLDDRNLCFDLQYGHLMKFCKGKG